MASGKVVLVSGMLAALAGLHQAQAAEGGLGTYLLGSKGPTAAATPGPGWYFQNDLYFYKGNLGDNTGMPANGRLDFGVDGAAIITIPTFIYVSPAELAGGRLGFSLSLPVGNKDVDASLSIPRLRGESFTGARSDNRTAYGDPKVGAFLGWQSGYWHYQLGTQVNIPVGDYDNERMANISFNRWSTDVTGALTWLNPETGLDLSAALGMTVNGENSKTKYETGDELHLEAAAIQHFSKQFDAGFVGYHYEQVSGDRGEGAGDPFRGRVSALGLTAGYSFLFEDRPLSLRLKYFKEFNSKNRAEGDAAYLTLYFPLGSASN